MSKRIGFSRGKGPAVAGRFISILSGLAFLLAAAPGLADEPKDSGVQAGAPDAKALKEAKARYAQGTQLFKDGDYKLALIEFQRAYELAPNYRLLYNIGAVNFQLNNYVDALRALERYLSEGGKDIPAKRREEVEQDLKSLRARTARLTIVTDVQGAEVSIDNDVIGKTPFSTYVLVDAGRHKVVAIKEGRSMFTKTIVLAGASEGRIELEMPEVAMQPPAVATPPLAAQMNLQVQPQPFAPSAQQEPDRPSPPTSKVWIGWTVTGVLTAGAAATGIGAIVSTGALRTLRDTPGTTRANLDSKQAEARSLAIAADVMGGAAIISGVVSLVATLRSNAAEKARLQTQSSRLRFDAGPAGVSVSGSF